jgi:hypothetical protein
MIKGVVETGVIVKLIGNRFSGDWGTRPKRSFW